MIIVKPVGGLANRMRVLAAAVQLAESLGDSVQCIWVASDELGASYTELFKKSDRFVLVENKDIKLKSSYKKDKIKRLLADIWNKIHGVDYYFSIANVDAINNASGDYSCFFRKISPLLKKGKTVFFSSGSYLAELQGASLFEPTDELQGKIIEYASHFSQNTYGLHIRRTDNIWAIESSPLELFKKLIEDGIESNHDIVYYLSTDDKEVSKNISDSYGSHILVREKKYGRDSLAAMKDAVVDMWLLAKTQHIYGSYYSSFSEMSALIGKVKLTIVKQH